MLDTNGATALSELDSNCNINMHRAKPLESNLRRHGLIRILNHAALARVESQQPSVRERRASTDGDERRRTGKRATRTDGDERRRTVVTAADVATMNRQDREDDEATAPGPPRKISYVLVNCTDVLCCVEVIKAAQQ